MATVAKPTLVEHAGTISCSSRRASHSAHQVVKRIPECSDHRNGGLQEAAPVTSDDSRDQTLEQTSTPNLNIVRD